MQKSIYLLLIIYLFVITTSCGQTEKQSFEEKASDYIEEQQRKTIKNNKEMLYKGEFSQGVQEVLEWYDYKAPILEKYANSLKVNTLEQLAKVTNGQEASNIKALEIDFTMINKSKTPVDYSFFAKLKNLEYLKVAQLETIPSEFYKLTNLKVFMMRTNRSIDEGFTEELANLANLEFIDLLFSRIRLPESISTLKKLKTLRLYRMTNQQPYQAIYQIPNLESLWIKYSNEKDAVGIGNLTHLKTLVTNTLNGEITKLKNLTGLIINESRLTTIPVELSALQSLVALRLQGCQEIETAPVFVSELKNLEYMEIRDCRKLVSVPKEYTNLKHMKKFNIFYNPLYDNLEPHLKEIKEVVTVKNLKK